MHIQGTNFFDCQQYFYERYSYVCLHFIRIQRIRIALGIIFSHKLCTGVSLLLLLLLTQQLVILEMTITQSQSLIIIMYNITHSTNNLIQYTQAQG
jgi:hypothetical protein